MNRHIAVVALIMLIIFGTIFCYQLSLDPQNEEVVENFSYSILLPTDYTDLLPENIKLSEVRSNDKETNNLPADELELDYTCPNRCIINDPDFYIRAVTPDGETGEFYEYMISWGNEVVSSDTNMLKSPYITRLGDGILRLEIGYGTNHTGVQYFDLYNELVSEEYIVAYKYADYACNFEDKYLFAYITETYDAGEESTVLKIVNIFDGSIVAEIDRDFFSSVRGAEALMFLSDKEIYVEYERKSDIAIHSETGQIITNREIILFQQTDNPISFIIG